MIPWTGACQAPPSTGFSRQEYWNGLPFPSPGDLPDPGMESTSPALGVLFFATEPPVKPSGEAVEMAKLFKHKGERYGKNCGEF